MIVLVILIPVTFQAPVYADVPSLVSIEPWTSGSETILNITVRHSSPTGNHYIDLIQIDIEGTVNDVRLNSQSANPFVVQYNMGILSGEPSVRARAHCNLHGWGGWSTPQIIPEASSSIALVFLSFLLLISIYFTKKLRRHKRSS